jgi:hypothetical protein
MNCFPMRLSHIHVRLVLAMTGCLAAIASTGVAFEGRINAELTRGTETNALLYTVGPEQLRIAVTSTNWPHPVNIVELKSGAVTLVFLHNRSFVRLKPATETTNAPTPGPSAMPLPPGGLPPGIGPQPTTAPGDAPYADYACSAVRKSRIQGDQ